PLYPVEMPRSGKHHVVFVVPNQVTTVTTVPGFDDRVIVRRHLVECVKGVVSVAIAEDIKDISQMLNDGDLNAYVKAAMAAIEKMRCGECVTGRGCAHYYTPHPPAHAQGGKPKKKARPTSCNRKQPEPVLV
ncbi:MAG: hypothetical protein DRO99_04340, partial [Candidatus Aenigmatarchaeota archaeon]